MERYRFHADGTFFYVTFTVVDWLPVFVSEQACKLITDNLNFCHSNKGLRTNAYVIMPTHVHAICFHESMQAKALEAVWFDFRKFTGRRLAGLPASTCPLRLRTFSSNGRATIGRVDSGSQRAIRCRSKPSPSGRRSWITCTQTRAVRAWCDYQNTGGFRRRVIGWPVGKPKTTSS